MKLIGFRDFDWSSRGFKASIPTDAKPYLTITPTTLYRAGAPPAFGPSQLDARAIPCEFSWRGDQFASYEAAWNWLMHRLNVYDTRPGELRCEFLDGAIAKVEAILTLPNASVFGGVADITTLPAIFYSSDPLWTALTATSESKTFASALDMALAVPIDSSIADPPIITIQPTVQRAAGTADVGWKKRQVLRVTNNLATALVNFPYALDLGNTAAIVTAGNALASGNDLRIMRDGREIARTLDDWNTASTRAWITIANLAAGESFDVEVWYGNSAAGAPLTHDGMNEPALDMDTATNLIWKYAIDDVAANAGEGGWNLSSGTQVPTVSTDAPAAWRFATTLRSNDDTWQDRYSDYVATGTKYRAIFNAQRARAASLPALPEYADADGVMLYHPAGITQIRVDLTWLNQYAKGASGDPVGRVVILASQDGQSWTVVQEWSTVQATSASIAVANYAISPAAPYVAFAVWPYNRDRVPTTAVKGRSVVAAWDSTLEVTVNGASIAQSTVQTEESIYELATELRIGGDADSDPPPYRALRIGGASGRRFAVRLNERVKIDLGERRAEVWNSADTAKVADVPVYAIAAVERIDAAASEQASGRWLDLAPYTNPLENPSFGSDVLGWSRANTGAGVTANAPAFASGRMRSQITASTLGTGQIALREIADEYLRIGGRASVSVAVDLETSNANLVPVPAIWLYDSAQALIGAANDGELWTPAINTPYRRVLTIAPPASAVYYRVGVAVRTTAANATGSAYSDNYQPDGLDLLVGDTAIGTLVVSVSWLEQFL